MSSIDELETMIPASHRNDYPWGTISDKEFAMLSIRLAVSDLLCHEIASRLEDEQGEDESVEVFESRKRLEKECIYPGVDIGLSVRTATARLIQEGIGLFIDSAYEQVCHILLADARKMGDKFPVFVVLMNRHGQWFSYAMSLNGHGISPLDRPEIADWLDENDIKLDDGFNEIGFSESISIVQMLIDNELAK